MEKFKSQLGADSASILSENSPKNSLTYHRITPISPSYQATSEGQKGMDLLYKWTEHLKNCLAHIECETFNITRIQNPEVDKKNTLCKVFPWDIRPNQTSKKTNDLVVLIMP